MVFFQFRFFIQISGEFIYKFFFDNFDFGFFIFQFGSFSKNLQVYLILNFLIVVPFLEIFHSLVSFLLTGMVAFYSIIFNLMRIHHFAVLQLLFLAKFITLSLLFFFRILITTITRTITFTLIINFCRSFFQNILKHNI